VSQIPYSPNSTTVLEPPKSEASYLYHKNHMEKVGAQTRKGPSLALVEESCWNPTSRSRAINAVCP
jgi:hypothetical protein